MSFSVACIQMTSGADMAANIAKIEAMVGEAAQKGAQLIATPENTFFMGDSAPLPSPPPFRGRESFMQDEHPGVKAAAVLAKRHGVWLLVGSVSVSSGEGRSPDTDMDPGLRRDFNRSLLFNPKGEVAAHYDKIHLFDVEVGDGQVYRESAKMAAGRKAVVVELWGNGVMESRSSPLPHHPTTPLRLGLSICYDLRFPHLYRALAKAGAEVLAVPAAFTQKTGEAHWHVLTRARAIENGCFVIAPAQTGTHPGGRQTYGHSLIIDPWGKILADGGTQEGVVMAEIDMSQVAKVRRMLPSLSHDRPIIL